MFGENILYKEKISAAAAVVDVVVVVSAVRDSYIKRKIIRVYPRMKP